MWRKPVRLLTTLPPRSTGHFARASSHAPSGSIQGIALDSRGYIYVTDAMNHRVLEIAPADAM